MYIYIGLGMIKKALYYIDLSKEIAVDIFGNNSTELADILLQYPLLYRLMGKYLFIIVNYINTYFNIHFIIYIIS